MTSQHQYADKGLEIPISVVNKLGESNKSTIYGTLPRFFFLSFKCTRVQTSTTVIIAMLSNKLMLVLSLIYFTVAHQDYTIPKPEIIVYKPRGFSVSIPDSPGIRSFVFQGNINKELKYNRQGDIFKQISHKENEKWTFHDSITKLNVGDIIHYRLFVDKHSLGYRADGGRFTVKETSKEVVEQSLQDKTLNAVPQVHKNDIVDNYDNTVCSQNVMDLTRFLSQLHTKATALTKKNQQMRDILEQTPNARKLTLSGKIPPDGPAEVIVSFILREKLDLNPVIVSAERNSDRSITFEVGSVDDKLDILEIAKMKLVVTKIFIR